MRNSTLGVSQNGIGSRFITRFLIKYFGVLSIDIYLFLNNFNEELNKNTYLCIFLHLFIYVFYEYCTGGVKFD
jgi:hypothetical protein